LPLTLLIAQRNANEETNKHPQRDAKKKTYRDTGPPVQVRRQKNANHSYLLKLTQTKVRINTPINDANKTHHSVINKIKTTQRSESKPRHNTA
jgi:hypothetical protein